MNLERKKTIKKNVSIFICLSFMLTLLSVGSQAATINKPQGEEILDEGYQWLLSICALINPNCLINSDVMSLLPLMKTQDSKKSGNDNKDQKDKSDKDKVKDHRNSTSKKRANGED